MDAREISRRSALAKLGLAAGAAYAAPTVLRLDRSYAKVRPSGCGGHGGGGGHHGHGGNDQGGNDQGGNDNCQGDE